MSPATHQTPANTPICRFTPNDGSYDWYRFALKYPYEIGMIDGFDAGILQKYNGGDIRDPMQSTQKIFNNITHLHPAEYRVYFKYNENFYSPEKQPEHRYGYFVYATETICTFSSLQEMNADIPGTEKLQESDFKNLKHFYDLFCRGEVLYPPEI